MDNNVNGGENKRRSIKAVEYGGAGENGQKEEQIVREQPVKARSETAAVKPIRERDPAENRPVFEPTAKPIVKKTVVKPALKAESLAAAPSPKKKGSLKLSALLGRTGKKPVKREPESEAVSARNVTRSMLLSLAKTAGMIVIGLVVVAVVCYVGFKYAYNHYFTPMDVNDKTQVEVIIASDDTLAKISKKLQEAGIIRSATIFKYYVDFSDMSSKLLAGKFTLSPSMTFDDIISVLKRPSAAAATVKATFAEGISAQRIGELFVVKGVLKNNATFMDKVMDGKDYSEYWFIDELLKSPERIAERDNVLEGYLFPETYEFYISSTEEQAITRLLDQFETVYTDAYKKRADELGMTTDEVVTLASIIEKEAKSADFKKVSAVLHNRLAIEMPLQSCATLQYFMPEKKFVYTTAETKTPSPYNTYIHAGLPVGPICNPGKAAIEAALWPDESFIAEKYMYFCVGDPNKGETIFAKDYEEHKRNVAKYSPLWK